MVVFPGVWVVLLPQGVSQKTLGVHLGTGTVGGWKAAGDDVDNEGRFIID